MANENAFVRLCSRNKRADQPNYDITLSTNKKYQFRDAGIFLQSAADGKLLISSDGTGIDDIYTNGTVKVTETATATVTSMFTVATPANKTISGGVHNVTLGATNTAAAVFQVTDGSSYSTLTFLKIDTADTGGFTAGTSMFKDPTSDAQAGHVTITIGGTNYQMAYYASS